MIYDISMKPILGLGKKKETGTSRIGCMEPLQEILICTDKTP
jgi:hypothetical protein